MATVQYKQVASVADLADLAQRNAARAGRLAASAAAPRADALANAAALGRNAALGFAALQRAVQARYDKQLRRTRLAGWGIFAAAFAALVGLALVEPRKGAEVVFLADTALILACLAGLGLGANQRLLGAAIDARNRISLSKLQMLLWSTLVIAALLAMTSQWLHVAGVVTPLDPPAALLAKAPKDQRPALIPGELLLAMGISAASFLSTPVLLSLKSGEDADPTAVQDLQATRGTPSANTGKVDARSDPAEARLSDIFRGDEVANAQSIDVGKVQQIAISLLLLGLYVGAVYSALQEGHGLILGLPPLNGDFVKLLAISHASYLAYKAAPKTSSAPAT